ncbi:kinase-like domain-containing protein [Schizophyllum fasciatum]
MAFEPAELEKLQAAVNEDKPFLPTHLAHWRELCMMTPRGISSTYLVWAYLSATFERRGYELYVPRKLAGSRICSMIYPAGYVDSVYPADGKYNYGPYGVLGSPRYVCPFYATAAVWAANNDAGDEFILKVVSDGEDPKGLNELRILQYLTRADARADSRNHAVPSIEFIEHERYTFAVFSRWTDFPESEIVTPMTAIECCAQITEGLAFLHEKRIAHLDISIENFMINVFGYIHPSFAPSVEFLPVKYGIIDFGESVFLDANSESLAPPRDYAPRPTSAPEVSSGLPFDPFAADVYQTAFFMLEQFYDLTGFTPDFLNILHAMTRPVHERISMAEAARQMSTLRDSWRDDAHPEIINAIGRPQNKYTRTYLNARRPFPGSMTMPANDAEAMALRERMREERPRRGIRLPTRAELLRVDPVPGCMGCTTINVAELRYFVNRRHLMALSQLREVLLGRKLTLWMMLERTLVRLSFKPVDKRALHTMRHRIGTEVIAEPKLSAEGSSRGLLLAPELWALDRTASLRPSAMWQKCDRHCRAHHLSPTLALAAQMGELSDDVRSLIEQEKNISEWREVGHIRPRQITSAYLVWRHLEHTFSDEGYSLYIPQKHLELDGLYHTVVFPPTYFDSVVNKNKLGAYGMSLQSIFATFNFDVAECSPLVWAALNRAGDEVVIKVIYDGHSAKGLNELKILKHLSRQDVRADFRNRTIPVLEFIEHAQYVFAVFPRWTDYPIGEVKSPKTAIECCAQITEVLAFLHDHRIAHLDISHENIMINVSGFLPGILRPVEHLSIRYHFIDFGESVLLGSPSDGLPVAPPRQFAPRPTSAPEVGSGKAFNPFAADVYQVAIFMLEQFYVGAYHRICDDALAGNAYLDGRCA